MQRKTAFTLGAYRRFFEFRPLASFWKAGFFLERSARDANLRDELIIAHDESVQIQVFGDVLCHLPFEAVTVSVVIGCALV
jgi:hypothetical protein